VQRVMVECVCSLLACVMGSRIAKFEVNVSIAASQNRARAYAIFTQRPIKKPHTFTTTNISTAALLDRAIPN